MAPKSRKVPSQPPSSSSSIDESSPIMKWLPFIVAGGALGISAYMFIEMQKMKKEKVSKSNSLPTETKKQIEAMDDQLRKVSSFLAHQFPSPPPQAKKEEEEEVTDEVDEEDAIETEEVIVETSDDEDESVEDKDEE